MTNGILERAGVDLEAENGTGNGGQEDAEMKIKPSVGTVVKVEGEEGEAEGDPFAMISAVDLKVSRSDLDEGRNCNGGEGAAISLSFLLESTFEEKEL